MIYVTEQELKMNIRELRTDIKAVAKDLGAEIKMLHNMIVDLEEIIELQNTVIQDVRKMND